METLSTVKLEPPKRILVGKVFHRDLFLLIDHICSIIFQITSGLFILYDSLTAA